MRQIPRANVYDLRDLQPLTEYRYFLDTNILKFVFARTGYQEKSYQTKHYPAFFKRLMIQKATIKFTFTQNILEMFSILDFIEKEQKNLSTIKDYRISDLETYLNLRQEIFNEIKESLQIFSTTIKSEDVSAYLNIDFPIDVKDYIYYLHANDAKTAFVTDDFEFIYIDGITMFTANKRAIETADQYKTLR